MNGRERVMRALRHEEPDRVPLDLASHRNSSIHRDAYSALRRELGMAPEERPVIINKMMQDVAVEEAILRSFGVDVRGIFPGLPPQPDQLAPECGSRRGEETWLDEWGVTWVVSPDGHYYDLSRAPLSGEITARDIASYPWPDPDDPAVTAGLREQVDRLRRDTDCALVLDLPSMFVHQSQYMRGFEDWYVDLAAQPSLSEALFDAVLDVKMG